MLRFLRCWHWAACGLRLLKRDLRVMQARESRAIALCIDGRVPANAENPRRIDPSGNRLHAIVDPAGHVRLVTKPILAAKADDRRYAAGTPAQSGQANP